MHVTILFFYSLSDCNIACFRFWAWYYGLGLVQPWFCSWEGGGKSSPARKARHTASTTSVYRCLHGAGIIERPSKRGWLTLERNSTASPSVQLLSWVVSIKEGLTNDRRHPIMQRQVTIHSSGRPPPSPLGNVRFTLGAVHYMDVVTCAGQPRLPPMLAVRGLV